jgi:hypothetical protein
MLHSHTWPRLRHRAASSPLPSSFFFSSSSFVSRQ